jgi:hypothetical protein
MARPTREQARARHELIRTFVTVMGDDATVTLQTDLDEAIERLPDDRRDDALTMLAISGLDGTTVRLQDLFRDDPDLG